jgi:ribonuclease P protein component
MIAVGRLRRRAEFLKVAAGRRKWATPGLIMQVRPWDDSERTALPPDLLRVGFTASRKVGPSVDRNRARRRLRAAVRETLPRLGCPAHDYVLIARTATLTRTYPALLGDIETALDRLAARCEDGNPVKPARGSRA